MSKSWDVPHWMTPEDMRCYEGMVESLHHVVQLVRHGANEVNPALARDVETWGFWVTTVTKEADEWAERLTRVFGESSGLRATNETPTVGSTEGT